MVIVCELAGFVLIAAAAVMFDLVAGVACCGVLLLVVGYLLDSADVHPTLPRVRFRRPRPAKTEAP